MSRAERERWAIGSEKWPHLQAFLSERMADEIFGEIDGLVSRIERELIQLEFDQKAHIAVECWTFMKAFANRHDDRQFLRDGFGVHGTVRNDDRGRGQTGLARLKLVYDAFAESLRGTDARWRPEP